MSSAGVPRPPVKVWDLRPIWLKRPQDATRNPRLNSRPPQIAAEHHSIPNPNPRLFSQASADSPLFKGRLFPDFLPIKESTMPNKEVRYYILVVVFCGNPTIRTLTGNKADEKKSLKLNDNQYLLFVCPFKFIKAKSKLSSDMQKYLTESTLIPQHQNRLWTLILINCMQLHCGAVWKSPHL